MASLIKRGEVTKDGKVVKPGVYYARHIYRVNGIRKETVKSLDTTDQRTAFKRLETFEREIEAGKWGEAAAVQFDEIARMFLADRKPHIKPKTYQRYVTNIRQLVPHFAGMKITEITKQSIGSFVTKRKGHKGRAGKKLSAASIKADLAGLSAIFGWCMEKERFGIEANPVMAYMKGEGKRDVKGKIARTRYLSHEEERRLLQCALEGPAHSRDYRIKLHDCIKFAIETGVRQQEEFGLTWLGVQIGDKPHLALHETKSGKPRRVPLSPVAQEIVARQRRHSSMPYVFWIKEGKRITSLKVGFKALCERAGISDLQWHDLRRTAGCRLLQDKGASILEVSRFLGHSSVAVTEKHYAFLREEALDDVVNRPSIRDLPAAEIIPLRGPSLPPSVELQAHEIKKASGGGV